MLHAWIDTDITEPCKENSKHEINDKTLNRKKEKAFRETGARDPAEDYAAELFCKPGKGQDKEIKQKMIVVPKLPASRNVNERREKLDGVGQMFNYECSDDNANCALVNPNYFYF